MRCEICGRRAMDPLSHDCPKAVLDRIDREDREADLEAEIQEDDWEEEKWRLMAMRDELPWT